MKQDIIQRALENIRERKRTAEEAFSKQMEPLYKNQKFCELEQKYAKIMIKNAKKASLNEFFDKNEEISLKNQIEKMKAEHNVTTPNYSCKTCKDEGFLNGQMCKCLKKEISKVLLKDSGFETLEDFKESEKTAGELRLVYEKMRQWCQSDFKKNLIYIYGPTGVGKTHLMKAMANELIERGKVVRLVTAFKINQDFKSFSKSFDDEILNKYLQTEILFIDDLGTEPLYKNVTLEYFYLVINERKMKKLPTIITSNLDLYDIRERYDERIFSRIMDSQTSIALNLIGKDKRLKNH